VHQKEKRCALAFSHHKGTIEVQGAKLKKFIILFLLL
jgi:hypothetical protein